MADTFYPYSRQEAKREGALNQWERSHRLNVRCARDIDRLIASHTQDGQLEPDCARAALDCQRQPENVDFWRNEM